MTSIAEHKELRAFGLLVGAVFSAIGLWPTLIHAAPPRFWALVLGGALIGLGLTVPVALRPVHRIWMKVGHVLGYVNTRILLGLIFFLVVTPMGIMRRALGKDAMQKVFAQDATTYRVPKSPRHPAHMKHQF